MRVWDTVRHMRLELFFVLWLVCLSVPRPLPVADATAGVAECARLALLFGFVAGALGAYALSCGVCVSVRVRRAVSCCACAAVAASWFAIAVCAGGEAFSVTPLFYASIGIFAPFCVPHWADCRYGAGDGVARSSLVAVPVCAWAVVEACLIMSSALATWVAPAVCGCAALLCLALDARMPVSVGPFGLVGRGAFAFIGQFVESIQVHPMSVLIATVVFWTAFGFALWPVTPGLWGNGPLTMAPVALVTGSVAGLAFVRRAGGLTNSFTAPRAVAPYLCCAVSIMPVTSGVWRSLFVAIVVAFLAFSLVLTVDSNMEIAQHDDRCAAAVFTGSVLPCAVGLLLGCLFGWVATCRGGFLAPATALAVGAAVATSASFLLVERNSLPLWRQGSLTHEGAFIDCCAQMQRAYRLTDRETDVLFLVARGCNASSVASQMCLSPHTVKTHMKHIYSKMGVRSQQEIITLMRGEVVGRAVN